MSDSPRRVGVFGGSFDPVHNAHVALARSALGALGLDELRWVVAGNPWQKARAMTPAAHRDAMVCLAIAGEPRFVLDRREIERQGPSYTVDTLRELAAEQPGAQLFLVIGQDQHAGLATWREWREILRLATLAVAGRPGAPTTIDADVAAASVHTVPLPPAEVSSTTIRTRLAAGQGITDLVPPAVARYIETNGLYRGEPGS